MVLQAPAPPHLVAAEYPFIRSKQPRRGGGGLTEAFITRETSTFDTSYLLRISLVSPSAFVPCIQPIQPWSISNCTPAGSSSNRSPHRERTLRYSEGCASTGTCHPATLPNPLATHTRARARRQRYTRCLVGRGSWNHTPEPRRGITLRQRYRAQADACFGAIGPWLSTPVALARPTGDRSVPRHPQVTPWGGTRTLGVDAGELA